MRSDGRGAGRIVERADVDAVAIDHTKAVDVKSGALYRRLKAEGVDFIDLEARSDEWQFETTEPNVVTRSRRSRSSYRSSTQ